MKYKYLLVLLILNIILNSVSLFAQSKGNENLKQSYKILTENSYNSINAYCEMFKKVDPKYTGVKNYMDGLCKIGLNKSLNIDKITIKNLQYWRAIMEMAPGNPSIIFSHGYLISSTGKIDIAHIYFFLGSIGMSKDYSFQLDSFNGLYGSFLKELEKEVKIGIGLHDRQKYKQAINKYDEIIDISPHIAWVWYEKGFSHRMMKFNKNISFENTIVTKMFKKTRECNPFYLLAHQGADKEVLNKMRIIASKISPLIHEQKINLKNLEKFAFGCEEMKLHSIAAIAFWKTYNFTEKGGEKLFHHFIYNVRKSGCEDITTLLSKKYKKEYNEYFKK